MPSYEKVKQNIIEKNVWKKQSIFLTSRTGSVCLWDTALMLCILRKNVCDRLIGTLLNIPSKTKDGVKSRLDLVEMSISEQLVPEQKEKIRI